MRQNFSQVRWAKLKPRPVFNCFSEAESFSTNLSTKGVIKSDADIEFHVNFCHPNPMKPAMPTLDEKDIVLLQRIKRHPLLRARVESLLGVVEDAGGDLEKADAAERRVIEELRQMGNEVLTEWARGGIDKCAAQAQEREEVRSGGKKNSTGTRPSAKSR
jgi:hypothetical protein